MLKKIWQTPSIRIITLLTVFATVLLLVIVYTQPRSYSTTEQSKILAQPEHVLAVLKEKHLRKNETLLLVSNLDLSYRGPLLKDPSSPNAKGSITALPSSAGTQLIWTLEYDAGYSPWARFFAVKQLNTAALELRQRLFELKESIERADVIPPVATPPVTP